MVRAFWIICFRTNGMRSRCSASSGASDEGDESVAPPPRSANVLADDQTGTVLGDYLAARAAKEGGQ